MGVAYYGYALPEIIFGFIEVCSVSCLRKHSPVGVLTKPGNIIILKIRYITLIESNIDKIRYILDKMYEPLSEAICSHYWAFFLNTITRTLLFLCISIT